ncbi:hypothetical protein COO60DRAFT_601225 [Scenedesmus sp. NREL 46B-D3]|nr:hypothetical protein COO60DRAFT_601225 [Scenedesmus sp. NREL 46B-D3]
MQAYLCKQYAFRVAWSIDWPVRFVYCKQWIILRGRVVLTRRLCQVWALACDAHHHRQQRQHHGSSSSSSMGAASRARASIRAFAAAAKSELAQALLGCKALLLPIPASSEPHLNPLPSSALLPAAAMASTYPVGNYSAHIQYKYVVRNSDGSVVRWQEGDNVSLELPGGPAEALALDVEDSWNKSKQVKRILAAGTPVRFNIRLKVDFGQHLLVVGSCASLGAWNVDNAVRLTWQEGNVWESSVELPAGELVEYKYVIRNGDTSVDKWQPGDNLAMEVPVAQANNGRRRGVLVLDTWSKASKKAKAKPPHGKGSSWRSTPYSSVPAGATGVAVHTDSPRFGGSEDINSAASAVAARSYYSMMEIQGSSSSLSSSREAASGIRDPNPQQHDPNVMQHWTDKPRFAQSGHQAHQDPWSNPQDQPEAQPEPPQPQVFVPPPRAGAGPEEYARWQALQSVMAALAHSSELDHWVEDPTDPRMLAADRRLAALTAGLATGNSSNVATATATAMR